MSNAPAFIVNRTAYDLVQDMVGVPELRDTAYLVIPVIAFGRDEVEASVGRLSDEDWSEYLGEDAPPPHTT